MEQPDFIWGVGRGRKRKWSVTMVTVLGEDNPKGQLPRRERKQGSLVQE